jgi:hypothetical protein
METMCVYCQGLGFAFKPFARQGVIKIDGIYEVIKETETCVICKGTGRIENGTEWKMCPSM